MNDLIDALFVPFWYDYDEEDILRIIDVLKAKIRREVVGNTEIHEADYIFQILVQMYGDYGTAPRVGWINDDYRDLMIMILDKWYDRVLEELNRGEE